MKNQHLIVLDLDGTLLKEDASYDEETFAYLRMLQQAGHLIVLATGRPFRSSYFIYQALHLKTPLINYNGARIANPTDAAFPKTDYRIERSDLLQIIEHVQDTLINVFCEIMDDIYVQSYDSQIKPFLHIDGGTLHVGPLKEILPDHPNGALFFLKQGGVTTFQSYIENGYHGKLLSRYWYSGGYHIVEIYHPLVDKQCGVKQIMDYYHIPQERTIAIGDGHNDIGLLQIAGIKVAMANAHPDLLPYANVFTASCDEQGVLHFLKSYFDKI